MHTKHVQQLYWYTDDSVCVCVCMCVCVCTPNFHFNREPATLPMYTGTIPVITCMFLRVVWLQRVFLMWQLNHVKTTYLHEWLALYPR